jgi:hypothetical protein
MWNGKNCWKIEIEKWNHKNDLWLNIYAYKIDSMSYFVYLKFVNVGKTYDDSWLW